MHKELSKLVTKFKAQSDILSAKDSITEQLSQVIAQKNAELENRLENISRLIHKNEQLNSQLRVQKQRTERFKAEAIGNY